MEGPLKTLTHVINVPDHVFFMVRLGTKITHILDMAETRLGLAKEMLVSEKTYVKYMNQAIEFFKKPIGYSDYFTQQETRNVFSGIEEIYFFSTILLKELEDRLTSWNGLDPKDQRLGDIFSDLGPFLQVYSTYCTNYHNAIKMLMTKKERSKSVRKLLENLANTMPEGYDKQSLESLLIMPVQRIMRYEVENIGVLFFLGLY